MMPPEEDQPSATGDMHKKLVKTGHVDPEITVQTEQHTDWSQYSAVHAPIREE